MADAFQKSAIPFVVVSCKNDSMLRSGNPDPSMVEQTKRVLRAVNVHQTAASSPESQKRCISIVLRSILTRTSGESHACDYFDLVIFLNTRPTCPGILSLFLFYFLFSILFGIIILLFFSTSFSIFAWGLSTTSVVPRTCNSVVRWVYLLFISESLCLCLCLPQQLHHHYLFYLYTSPILYFLLFSSGLSPPLSYDCQDTKPFWLGCAIFDPGSAPF